MIQGEGLPEPQAVRKKLETPILRPHNNCVLALRLLAEVTGFCFHWNDGKDIPCLPGCRLCPDKNRKWKGYVPALLWRAKGQPWARVTLELRGPTAAPLAKIAARGLLIQVRKGDSKHASAELTIVERDSSEPAGWQEVEVWDVAPVVFRMCRVTEEQLQAEEPEPTVLPWRASKTA